MVSKSLRMTGQQAVFTITLSDLGYSLLPHSYGLHRPTGLSLSMGSRSQCLPLEVHSDLSSPLPLHYSSLFSVGLLHLNGLEYHVSLPSA